MSGILVDTSVWVEHFRRRNDPLSQLLALDLALTHPLIIGELACGTPPNRLQTLTDLNQLQQIRQATIGEVLALIEREKLFSLGCGLIDILLLASTILTPDAKLWSLDKQLCSLAEKFKVNYQQALH